MLRLGAKQNGCPFSTRHHARLSQCSAVCSAMLCCANRVNPVLKVPQALCMCTTRELVAQNLAVLRRIGKYTDITSTSTAEDGKDGPPRGRKLTEQVGTGRRRRSGWGRRHWGN